MFRNDIVSTRSNMSDENESIAVHSVKLPTFDGTHSSFQIWWMRFMAFATIHRFASAVSKEGPEEDLPESEGSAIPAGNSGAAARAALRRNSVAFANLSLALNSEQMVRLLINGQSEDWPSGLAWRVVEALH